MSNPGKNNSLSAVVRGVSAALAMGLALASGVGCSSQEEGPIAGDSSLSAPSADMVDVPAKQPDLASLPSKPFWTNFEINTSVHSVAFKGGEVWVATEGGLLRYDLAQDAVVARYDTSNGLFSNNVVSIDYAPDGGMWVGTHGGGLMHVSAQGEWTHTSVPDLGDSFVYQTMADVNGNGYWVATWSGLSHFDGKSWRTYTTEDGLVDDWVYAMDQDKDGTLWLGTEGGISVFDGHTWTTYDHKDGLGAARDRVGNYEVIGNPSIHHRQTPGKTADGYNPNYVLSVLIGSGGNKWIGTWGAGLSRFNGSDWVTFTTEDGLAGNYVTDLYQDDDGAVWATTDGGVSVYRDGAWQTYTRDDGLVSDSVFDVAVDRRGRMWFSTMNGISRLDGFSAVGHHAKGAV